MLKTMKFISMKRIFRLTRYVLFLGIAIIVFFSGKAIRQWKGPSDLTTLSQDNLDNKFVTVNVTAAYGLLYRDTLYEGKYAQYYLLSIDGIDGFVTLDVPFKEMPRLATMLAPVLLTPGQQSSGNLVALNGVINLASEAQSDSYSKYVVEQNLRSVMGAETIHFYFNPTEQPYGATGGYVLWTKIGIAMVFFVIISYILGVLGIYQLYARLLLKKKSKEELQFIEEEYKNAKQFTGDIRIGSNYTFLHIGPISVILENQEIISVYSQNMKFEFRKAVNKQELFFQTKDQRKFKTTIKSPGVILTYYKEKFPKIQVDEWYNRKYSSYS